MKAAKLAIVLLLAVALGVVGWRLLTRESFFSPVDFTSPPLPLLRRGYTGTYTGALVQNPGAQGCMHLDYTTLPWLWTRV